MPPTPRRARLGQVPPSPPPALIVKGQCGSPLSFPIPAALAKAPKKEKRKPHSGWGQKGPRPRPPPAVTCPAKCPGGYYHEAFQPTPGQLGHGGTQAGPPLTTSLGLGFWVPRVKIVTRPSWFQCDDLGKTSGFVPAWRGCSPWLPGPGLPSLPRKGA